jgi:hypothetical protein
MMQPLTSIDGFKGIVHSKEHSDYQVLSVWRPRMIYVYTLLSRNGKVNDDNLDFLINLTVSVMKNPLQCTHTSCFHKAAFAYGLEGD